MKKKFLYAITLCTFAVTTILNVQTVLRTNKTVDLTLTTLESISDDENSPGTGVDIETGGGIGDESTCRSIGGYWNMALICASSNSAKIVCSKTGELSLFNSIIKGSYTVGREYTVFYEQWTCTTSTGNCCNASG